jgi:chemotaxis protein MotB
VSRSERRAAGNGSNPDRWLVSYSDFITLLFAFFVVLFASSYQDNRAIPVISHAIHSGFQELGARPGTEFNQDAESPQDADAAIGAAKVAETRTLQERAAASAADMLLLRKQLETTIGPELRNHEIMMRITPEGFVISLSEMGFFDSGKAALLPGAAQKVKRIASVLAQHGFHLRIEGHSDNQPIHNGQFRSNWELSSSRAMAVLSLLVGDSTFDPAKLSVAGYGEFRPVASNDTPEGRRLNRRVDLVVVATTSQPSAR